MPLLLFELAFQVCVSVVARPRLDYKPVREQVLDVDIQRDNQYLRCIQRPDLLTLTYFAAGLVAGAAAFSSLAGVLFAGLAASFLTSALAGTGALAAGAGAAGALAGSAAKADTANTVARIAIAFFILSSF